MQGQVCANWSRGRPAEPRRKLVAGACSSQLAALNRIQKFPAAAVTAQSAQDAYDRVLARAGTKVRDAGDQRVIAEVKARAGQVGRPQ